MRGASVQQGAVFIYAPVDGRIPADHVLSEMRALPDETLASMSRYADCVYVECCRSSASSGRMVRTLAPQVGCSM